MQIALPSKATFIASLLLGVATVVIVVLEPGGLWTSGLTIGATWLATFNIAPITGLQFKSALQLTPLEGGLAAVALTVINLILVDASLSTGWHAALVAVVNIAAGLGFGPDTIAAVKATRAKLRLAR